MVPVVMKGRSSECGSSTLCDRKPEKKEMFACFDLNELWAAAVPEESGQVEAKSTANRSDAHTLQRSQLDDGSEPSIVGDEESTFPTAVESKERHERMVEEPVSVGSDKRSFKWTKVVNILKNIVSGILFAVSIVIVSAAIFNKQTSATANYNLHPTLVFCLFWLLLLWLALVEAGLNCIVALKPFRQSLYAESHVHTARCTTMSHKGDNLQRFIIGRQFLDLCCVFLINFMATPIAGAAVLGLPAIVNDIFLGASLGVVLVTIVLGQLVSQINAAHCMLDFINNWAMVISTFIALALESSGLLHSVYLVQRMVALLAGRKIEYNETPSTLKQIWFWLRVAVSTTLLGAALVVTITAIIQQKTTAWERLHIPVSFGILAVAICMVGYLDSLQIAIVAVMHLPSPVRHQHPVANKNIEECCKGTNLQSFLVGRQIFQTVIHFVIARITTLNIDEGEPNILGINNSLQNLFNTGIPAAFISTVLASLVWRVLASNFPIAILSFPIANPMIKMCLYSEYTGICHISWFIASINRKIFGLQPDEVYLGSDMGEAVEKLDDGCTSNNSSSNSSNSSSAGRQDESSYEA